MGHGSGRVTPSAAAGDERFRSMYDQYYPAVFAYCSRRTNRSDAFDATSEVFLTAWRRLDEVPPEDRTLSWLYGTAYRVLSNQWRSRDRRRRLVTRLRSDTAGSGAPQPEFELVRSEAAREVVDALSKLNARDQEMLRLAEWEEMSPAEIAELIGVSRNAIDQRLHRARERLAREMNRANAANRWRVRPSRNREEVRK